MICHPNSTLASLYCPPGVGTALGGAIADRMIAKGIEEEAANADIYAENVRRSMAEREPEPPPLTSLAVGT